MKSVSVMNSLKSLLTVTWFNTTFFLSLFLFTCVTCVYFGLQQHVRTIEKTPTGANDRPAKDVVIVNSRAEVVAEPFSVTKDSAQ